jgi:hypothetical protein
MKITQITPNILYNLTYQTVLPETWEVLISQSAWVLTHKSRWENALQIQSQRIAKSSLTKSITIMALIIHNYTLISMKNFSPAGRQCQVDFFWPLYDTFSMSRLRHGYRFKVQVTKTGESLQAKPLGHRKQNCPTF